MTIAEVIEKRGKLIAELEKLAGDDSGADWKERWEQASADLTRLETQHAALSELAKAKKTQQRDQDGLKETRAANDVFNGDRGGIGKPASGGPKIWTLADGRELPVFRNCDKVSDYYGHDDDFSIGRAARAMCLERLGQRNAWKGAEYEKRALDTTTSTKGPEMTPDPISSRYIDLAREASKIVQAGALTIPMNSYTLNLARLATDVPMAWEGQGDAGVATDPTFGQLTLTGWTLRGYVIVSRELLADAVNGSAFIEQSMIAKAGEMLDLAFFEGSGSDAPTGIDSLSGVNTQAGGDGTLSWALAMGGAAECLTDAATPNALFCHPRDWKNLYTEEGAATGNDHFKDPPIPLQNNFRVFTNKGLSLTQDTDKSYAYIGNFNNAVVGMRMDAGIEIDTFAASANYQARVHCILRGDVAPLRPTDFCKITALTAT